MSAWILVAYLILSAFCIFSAVRLYASNRPEYGKAVLATHLFYTAALLGVWLFKASVPVYLFPLTMLTVLLSCFCGHYLQYYNKSRVFDRYLHAFGTFSFALFAYCALDDFLSPGGSRLFQALFVVLLGNTLGVLFEMSEMLHDFKKNVPQSQKGLRDTNMDELFNFIGSLFAGAFAFFWIVK